MADGRHCRALAKPWIARHTAVAASIASADGRQELGDRVRIFSLAGAAAALLLGLGMTRLAALPLTPFRYEDQAQRYCPTDKVVWLDFKKGIYYRKGQKLWGQGFDGSFVCLNEARSSGFRRSLLGVR